MGDNGTEWHEARWLDELTDDELGALVSELPDGDPLREQVVALIERRQGGEG